MKKSFSILLTVVCTFLLISGASWAGNIGFDDVATQGGDLSYDGAGGALIGEDIIFDQILGTSTPAHSGDALAITNGLLNFTTGANMTEGPVWMFANGGSFVLTGGVAALSIADGTVLLSGSFTGPNIATSAAGKLNFTSFGIDDKHQAIADYYGVINEGWTFANTEITALVGEIGADGSFDALITNADINNTPVPEPTTILLSGLGLLGLGVYLRRRSKKA